MFQLQEIPPPSGIALEALRVAGDEQADLEQLVRLIEKSPELAVRILRCANSAYYGQRRHIHSVREAVIRVLGLSISKGLILALSMASAFKTSTCPEYQVPRHWFVAIATASLARDLAAGVTSEEKVSPAMAYSAGLIHNLGLLALVHTFPREMNEALKHGAVGELSRRIEARLGMDHRLAGGWLAQRWGLPEDLVLAVRHHGAVDYTGNHWPLVRLVGGAARIADRLFMEGAMPPLPAEWGAGLIAAGDCEAAIQGMLEQLDELKSLARQMAGSGG
ncbi:HDOD domain-containing protein [Desulfuromonas versatilis]|uniref:HDOD domain-containing protein n=1 Tax=Desulfuromonas versatilis TaxID=2802975 RepID=UPI001C84BE03|nr:HDOD domain-containing protein [Desulfuromonas versatilis]